MNSESSAKQTRKNILHIAAEEIHLHGFQSCSTSTIIKKAGISKGALYHHFANKQALGYAVVDEVFAPHLLSLWEPVFKSDDPIPAMISLFTEALNWTDCESISKGCPMNNLAQEMSPVDEGFRLRISDVMCRWQGGLEKALIRGQGNGHVSMDIDAKQTATFLIASIGGAYGLAKSSQDVETLSACVYALIAYLESLAGGTA